MAPGGRLVASGIFRDREGDVRTAFEAAQRQEYKTAAHPLTERGYSSIGTSLAGAAQRCQQPLAVRLRGGSVRARQQQKLAGLGFEIV